MKSEQIFALGVEGKTEPQPQELDAIQLVLAIRQKEQALRLHRASKPGRLVQVDLGKKKK